MTATRWKWMIAAFLFTACEFRSAPAISQSKPPQNVLVVNGERQPVPTTAQGTTNIAGTVNIDNTPNVHVANTPSVAVTNTPTVSLVAGARVNVSNPLDVQSNPTPLTVLEATQPYEDVCVISFGGSGFASCNFQSIPSGKRLVIQEFDATGHLETGLKPTNVALNASGSIPHAFTATFMGSTPVSDVFATHQETHLYAGPGRTPFCFVALSNGSNLIYFCALSGFLVDVQSP